MKTKFQLFRELHRQTDPLLIGNVWNVQSAICFEKAGFKAIATSSAAVAATLGYNDGEAMPFDEYVFVIRRISKSVHLPLSVDLEGGYGRTASHITENIIALHKLGVVGVNIEDSLVTQGSRSINDHREFANLLKLVCKELKARNVEMFINVRSDVFLLALPDSIGESIRRINAYQTTGVNGLFFPCVIDPGDIRNLVVASKLPLNVMCMSDLPEFAELAASGVRRISMGNFFYSKLYAGLDTLITETIQKGSFRPVF
jgi:2-methylisocitrate lyase-like PEP mutase family enzyme